MLNAAFRRKFSRMYPAQGSEEDVRRRKDRSDRKRLPRARGRRDLPEEDVYDDDEDNGMPVGRASSMSYGHRGNCRKFISLNQSDSDRLPQNRPRERRYQKNGNSYRRLDTGDHAVYSDVRSHGVQSRPKYGPRDIEVWSKRSSSDRLDNRPQARQPGDGNDSNGQTSGLREWLSWRRFLNQNLAHTILRERGGTGVRTVCAQPDFGEAVVRYILEEFAEREQKPPTTLHENDYLMFGVPRAQLKTRPLSTVQPPTDVAQSPRRLLRAKPSAPNLQSLTIQKMIAQRVKTADSKCLPSLRWKSKRKKDKGEAVSEPDYLPSRYAKVHSNYNNSSARKISSDDERIRLYRDDRLYSPWGHVARSRDLVALPPESSFLVRSRSQSSYWSTSSMTLSLTSSSSHEDGESSSTYSGDSSSLYSYPPRKPVYTKKASKNYSRRK